LGWLLGENWAIIERYTKILDYVAVSILILLVVGYIVYKKSATKAGGGK
jgi:membrane protein DedA with SNARE-associated domain